MIKKIILQFTDVSDETFHKILHRLYHDDNINFNHETENDVEFFTHEGEVNNKMKKVDQSYIEWASHPNTGL